MSDIAADYASEPRPRGASRCARTEVRAGLRGCVARRQELLAVAQHSSRRVHSMWHCAFSSSSAAKRSSS
jgi:hypothetical protein